VNLLYYGDNLDVLRRHVQDASVDLVYLDPPFKSNQDYNVLFAEQDGSRAAAQIKAFEDTWRWDQAAASAYQETVEAGGPVSQVMQAFRTFLGDSDMLAYLAMMAPRLMELRRVLGVRHGETGKAWREFNPTPKGRHWFVPPSELDKLDARGRIYWPKKAKNWPRLKRYLDDSLGVPLQDVWTDIPPINSQAKERLGYPTQKPEALMERIIQASSGDGNLVLDPFCGCGTTVAVARWPSCWPVGGSPTPRPAKLTGRSRRPRRSRARRSSSSRWLLRRPPTTTRSQIRTLPEAGNP